MGNKVFGQNLMESQQGAKFKDQLLTFAISLVWLVNGLFCKVLGFVPRHEQIVGRILGDSNAPILTQLIGVSETIMAFWVLSRFRSRLNAILQMFLVAFMNILEFVLVPDLLLWGRYNALFAILFIGLVYCNEFVLNKSGK